MQCLSRSPQFPAAAHLRIIDSLDQGPPNPAGHQAWWRVNGQRVCVHVWTTEQWALLEQQPSDAQYYPCGIWCALRAED